MGTYVGRLVRLGPRLLSVQGPDAVQCIYTNSGIWKKPDEKIFSRTKHGILYAANIAPVECRRMLESAFSFKAIIAQQGVLLNCADTALTVTEIACENDNGLVDILQISRTYAFDVISMVVHQLN
jgi:hypothetical protein